MNIEIANRLQELRKKNGYSQEELANKLGISRQAVSKWERAESSPDTDNLICLAKLYNVSLDSLLFTEESIEDIKENQINEDNIDQMDKKTGFSVKLSDRLAGPIVLSIVTIYLFLGIVFDYWHPGWIIFLLIPILITLIDAITKKNGSLFAYPIFVLALYLFFSIEYGIWHPLWLIFITIPIYYCICDAFNKNYWQ